MYHDDSYDTNKSTSSADSSSLALGCMVRNENNMLVLWTEVTNERGENVISSGQFRCMKSNSANAMGGGAKIERDV